MKHYNIQDILYKLVKLLDQLDNIKQYASQNEMEPFTRNALEFAYFMSKFPESIEKKTDDPGYRLTLPLKYMSCSTWVVQTLWSVSLSDIVKHCNNSYQNVSKEYFLKRNNMTLDRNVLFKSFNKITKISTDLKNLIKVTWWVT